MPYDAESILATAIERLHEKMDRLDEKVDTVQKDLNEFKVLSEKIDHLEKRVDESNKRIHHRIDDLELRIVKTEKNQNETGCPTFQKFKGEHDNELKHNLKKIHDLESFKKQTELKPAKKWEHMNTVLIAIVISIIVAFIAEKVGMK